MTQDPHRSVSVQEQVAAALEPHLAHAPTLNTFLAALLAEKGLLRTDRTDGNPEDAPDPLALIEVGNHISERPGHTDQCADWAWHDLRCTRAQHPSHWNHIATVGSLVVAVRAAGPFW